MKMNIFIKKSRFNIFTTDDFLNTLNREILLLFFFFLFKCTVYLRCIIH